MRKRSDSRKSKPILLESTTVLTLSSISYYLITLCVCVCMYVCMYVGHVFAHVCTLCGGPRMPMVVFLDHCHLIPWDRISQSNPELSATSRPAVPACPTSAFLPGAGTTGCLLCLPSIYMASGDLTFGPHTCAANALITEPSLQLSCFSFTYNVTSFPVPFACLVLVDTSPTTFPPTFPRSPFPLKHFYPQDFPVYFPFKMSCCSTHSSFSKLVSPSKRWVSSWFPGLYILSHINIHI